MSELSSQPNTKKDCSSWWETRHHRAKKATSSLARQPTQTLHILCEKRRRRRRDVGRGVEVGVGSGQRPLRSPREVSWPEEPQCTTAPKISNFRKRDSACLLLTLPSKPLSKRKERQYLALKLAGQMITLRRNS